MVKKLLVGVMMVTVMVSGVQALDLEMGKDFYLDNFLDIRVYDESYPDGDKVRSMGGWKFGLFFDSDGHMAQFCDQIKEVTLEGERSAITMREPISYNFLGGPSCEFTFWMGSTYNADDIAFVVKGNAIDDTPINFFFGPDDPALNGIPAIPDTNAQPLPVMEVKNMAIKRDGEVRIKFTALPDPYRPRNEGPGTHIRVRIIDYETGDFLWQTKIWPDENGVFSFTKKDGTVVTDKLRVDIPAEFAGMTGRLEYRAYAMHSEYPSTGPYMVRSMTFFKLPEPDLE